MTMSYHNNNLTFLDLPPPCYPYPIKLALQWTNKT